MDPEGVAWIAVAAAWKRFGEGPPAPWILGWCIVVARNVSVGIVRRWKREVSGEEALWALPAEAQPGDEATADAGNLRAVFESAAWRRLAAVLTCRERQVLALGLVGYRVRGVANELGVTERSVRKVRASIARKAGVLWSTQVVVPRRAIGG